MLEIRTDESLLQALKAAAETPLSPEEAKEQELSFIVGCVGKGGNVNKADVRQVLERSGRASNTK